MNLEEISNRILIADDDRMNRMFLKKGVSGLPYEFVFAESGDAALEKILNELRECFLDAGYPKNMVNNISNTWRIVM